MKESRDILTLFEALSNHEVFTPPRVARAMLDLLPDEIWSDPNIKMLDPCVKSGVYLREAFFRFFSNLPNIKYEAHDGRIYDLGERQERINHILKNMLYGIAISELTSYMSRRTLYGVMRANTDKQIASIESFEISRNFQDWDEEARYDFIGRNQFNEYYDHNLFCTSDYAGFEDEGNIFYPVDEVEKMVDEDGDFEIEDKYYPFIEDETQHQKIRDIRSGALKFDVIIGNPPYQIKDGGHGRSARAVYHEFVEKAKGLNPKYISMIIPARWFSGGKGMTGFRASMLSDKRLVQIHDYADATDVFPGVQIKGGVCYFLWDNGNPADHCEVFNYHESNLRSVVKRPLLEPGSEIFIRYNNAISIVRKVQAHEEDSIRSTISARKPFGLDTTFSGRSAKFRGHVTLYQNGGVGYIKRNEITVNEHLIDKFKVLIPPLGSGSDSFPHSILGHPFVVAPNTACTETYLVAGYFDNIDEANNLRNYLTTKFLRFLVLLCKPSQHATAQVYTFVPQQDFTEGWTDEKLYKKYDLSQEEIEFIDSMIKPME